VLGLTLWRGGALLVVGYGGYYGLRAILAITDALLETAVSLILIGALFIVGSVIGERVRDVRLDRSMEE